jgi:dTDP-4-dehydrorhamnose 3,5-epimerase
VSPTFQELGIKGVWLARAVIHSDERGWLSEVFRVDWFERKPLITGQPMMGYVSVTLPGVMRGPHEHREQTDLFVFLGPADFRVVLWDNRSNSWSAGKRLELKLGGGNPELLIVPPGVVHAYQNIGDVPGWVLNFPDRLYRGWGGSSEADEIRYEEQADAQFRLEKDVNHKDLDVEL